MLFTVFREKLKTIHECHAKLGDSDLVNIGPKQSLFYGHTCTCVVKDERIIYVLHCKL